jgi:glycosyltransferase involved in cell wall biosynthesis
MRAAFDVPAALALRRLMTTRQVALVHTHSSVDSWLGALAARSLGRPVVRSRHVTIPIRRHRALIYRLADRVLASGDAVARIVAGVGIDPSRIVLVPAGVDTSRFHTGVTGKAVRDELGLLPAPAGRVVGLVANIRGSKGHEYFLEAARQVLGVLPDARFLIVGDGVGFEDVRRRVQALGLDGPVIMTGFRRDIPEVMAALDVLVLPSTRSEATSQVIPQALAVGTPVVATSAGGASEIVRDGETGRLVPPADVPALAAAIVDLLRDRERAQRLAQAGQREVLARYTVDVMMARTTQVYTQLLDGRRHGV